MNNVTRRAFEGFLAELGIIGAATVALIADRWEEDTAAAYDRGLAQGWVDGSP